MASQMANYVYVVISSQGTGGRSAVVVDACWDVDGLLRHCREELRVEAVSAAVYTHRHFDHTGGRLPRSMTGGRQVTVPGLRTLAEQGVAVAVGHEDAEAVAKQTGVDIAKIRRLHEGDEVAVGRGGDVALTAMHTPGHTTGSVCFHLPGANSDDNSILITGDTLFIGSCGRYDLPESDLRAMLASLDRLSKLPPNTLVLPGHNYSRPAHTTIGAEHDTNDMMIQAMGLVKSGRLAPASVAASLPLPDYLGVAERVASRFAASPPPAGSMWPAASDSSDGGATDDECCGHVHVPVAFFDGMGSSTEDTSCHALSKL